MKISVDVDELYASVVGHGGTLHVSEEDLKKITSRFGGWVSRTHTRICGYDFVVKPSIAAELDRLLAQRVKPSTDDRFVMSREVWQRYCGEKQLTPKSLDNIKIYERPDYRGVFIETQDEIDGGVQLKCDYYVKGNL